MVLRLFRLGVMIGLIALAIECLDLSHLLNDYLHTTMADWGQALER